MLFPNEVNSFEGILLLGLEGGHTNWGRRENESPQILILVIEVAEVLSIAYVPEQLVLLLHLDEIGDEHAHFALQLLDFLRNIGN